jgi:hypothetical protein
MSKRALFCRIGWMKAYDGQKPNDPRPIGGGSWNEEHCGDEVFNFRRISGLFYGFCQPSGKSNNIQLTKIEPSWPANSLHGVLVVFVAVDPERGKQRVVGWYRNATVYRTRQKSASKKRKKKGYFAVARVADSVLLPVEPFSRKFVVKAGLRGIGQANVCYLYDLDGRPKKLWWQRRIIEIVENPRLHHLL